MTGEIKMFEEFNNQFELYLKAQFKFNFRGYDKYIPEAKHLFSFEPIYIKDKKSGDWSLDYTNCKVIPPGDLLRKENFYEMSKRDQLEFKIRCKYSHLCWYDEHLERTKNGDYIAKDNNNLESLYKKFGVI